MIEILECILGKTFVFFSIGERDGGHILMPVSTVDQFVEFGERIFKIVEDSNALGALWSLPDCNFKGHGKSLELSKATCEVMCSR